MADAEDFLSLPLPERLSHKNWKARVSAYEELNRDFLEHAGEAHPGFSKYAPDLKKIAVDSHLAAQETGLATIISFLESAPAALCARVLRELLSPLLEKSFASVRALTKRRSIDIFLLAVEILESGDLPMDSLLAALNEKLPKLVSQTLLVIKEVFLAFGVRVVNVRPMMKTLPKMFSHPDKQVRSETSSLTVTLYSLVGDSILPVLSELKELQQKELNELFAACGQVRLQPTRLTRSQKLLQLQQLEQLQENGDTSMMDVENILPDAEILDVDCGVTVGPNSMEPEDVLKHVPQKFYEELASPKWKDRLAAMESLLPIIRKPRLKEGRYGELVSALSKRINEPNLSVSLLAIQAIDAIATGLRVDFSIYRSIVVSNLFEKTKEKKTNILEAIRKTLDSVFLSTSLEANMEDIVSIHVHKNPQVRTEVMRFLTRCLCNIRISPSKIELKSLLGVIEKGIDDGVCEIREASAETLGTLIKLIGERPLSTFLEKIDPQKRKKAQEFSETAVIKGIRQNSTASSSSSSSSVATSSTVKQSSLMALRQIPPQQHPINSQAGSNPSNRKGISSGVSGSSRSFSQSQSARFDSNQGNIAYSNSSSISQNGLINNTAGNTQRSSVNGPNQHAAVNSHQNQHQGNSPSGNLGVSQLQTQTLRTDPGLLPGDPRQKAKRWSEDRGSRKWTIENLRLEECDFFKDQAATCFTPSLVTLLFANGHYKERDHLVGLNVLHECVMNKMSDCIHHSDVILKYITIRFFDSNTTMLLKCFEIVECLAQLLDEACVQITDYEANAFLPFLLLKFGDAKEAIRARTRALLSAFSRLYHPSKVFNIVFKATEKKVSRVRSECIEELGEMIKKYGLECFSPKIAAAIASFVSDRDSIVRNAALATLVCIARVIGESQLYQNIGKIQEKERVLLEQRLKRSSLSEPSKNTNNIGDAMDIDSSAVMNTQISTPTRRFQQSTSQSQAAPSPIFRDHLQQPRQLQSTLHPVQPHFQNMHPQQMQQPAIFIQNQFAPGFVDESGYAVQESHFPQQLDLQTDHQHYQTHQQQQFNQNFDPSVNIQQQMLFLQQKQQLQQQQQQQLQQLQQQQQLVQMSNSNLNLNPAYYNGSSSNQIQMSQRDSLSGQTVVPQHMQRLQQQQMQQMQPPISQNFAYSNANYTDVGGGVSGTFSATPTSSTAALQQGTLPQAAYSSQHVVPSSTSVVQNVSIPNSAGTISQPVQANTTDSQQHSTIFGVYTQPPMGGNNNAGVNNPIITRSDDVGAHNNVNARQLQPHDSREISVPSQAFNGIQGQFTQGNSNSGYSEILSNSAQQQQTLGNDIMAAQMFGSHQNQQQITTGISNTQPQQISGAMQAVKVHSEGPAQNFTSLPVAFNSPLPSYQNYIAQMSNPVNFSLTPEKVGITQYAKKYDSIREPQSLIDFVISRISSESTSESLEAIRQIEKILSTQPHMVVKRVDGLLTAFAMQVQIAFSGEDTQQCIRLCKHLISAQLQLFEIPELACSIQLDTLEALVKRILMLILDSDLPSRGQGAGTSLVKALNMLMVRILERVPPNTVFAVLLKMLSSAMLKLDTQESVKYAEITMKCLWKVIRMIEGLLRQDKLRVESLLLDVNDFLNVIHAADLRRKQTPLTDIPIRTIKTILSELANFYSEEILNKFSLVPNYTESHAYNYTRQLLLQPKRNTSTTSTAKLAASTEKLILPSQSTNDESMIEETGRCESLGSNSVPDESIDLERLTLLGNIFAKIGAKEHSKEGISELYRFQKLYPELRDQVEERISKTGHYFQAYIKRNIDALSQASGQPENFEMHWESLQNLNPL